MQQCYVYCTEIGDPNFAMAVYKTPSLAADLAAALPSSKFYAKQSFFCTHKPKHLSSSLCFPQ